MLKLGLIVIMVTAIFLLLRAIKNLDRCPKCPKGYFILKDREELKGGQVKIVETCNQCNNTKERTFTPYSPYEFFQLLRPHDLL